MTDSSSSQQSELTAPEDAGRIDPSRKWRLIAIIAALVLYSEVAPMQILMISIILPKISASFPGVGANVTWIITIVGVAGGATMALLGKLGDLIGKKNVLLLSGLLFLAGTLLCVLTSSWPLFLLGRALGGASWAMTAVEYGIVRDLVPRKWIPISVSILGTGFGAGTVGAPLICGLLTDHYSWRSVFWFLVIYMVVTTPLVLFAIPESPFRVKQRFDIPGAVLFGSGVALVLLYVSEGSSWGWGNLSCLAYLLGGLVALAAFIAWELRTPEPMMELSLLRAPKVAIPMAAAFLVTMALAAVSIMIAYMFETPKASVLKGEILAGAAAQVHQPVSVVSQFITFRGDVSYANGFSVLQMALHITIWTAIFGVVAGIIGGWLCRRVGSRLVLMISGASLLLSAALWINWHSTWQEQVSIGVLYGVCFGFYYASNPNLLIDAVPAARQGVSAGMLAVFGSIGTSVAAAIFSAIIAAHPFQTVAFNPLTHKSIVSDIPSVYTNTAYSLGYVVLGVIPGVLVVLLALVLRTGRTPALGGATEASLVTEASGASAGI